MDRKPRVTLNRLLFAFLTAGFLFLATETFLEHSGILGKKPPALIPVAFSVVALLVSAAAAAAWPSNPARLVRAFFVLPLLVGLAGLYFHNEDRLEGHAALPAAIADEEEGEHDESGSTAADGHEEDHHPPILAPLAFVGMGVLGLLAAARRWPADID